MKQAISIALMLLLILAAGSAEAQTTVIELPVYKSAGQFWLDRNGNLQGFRLKVLDALNKELKKKQIKFKYKLTKAGEIPIKRCINEILKGNYDAYFGLIYSKDREAMGLIFSKTEIYSIPAVVWMTKSNAFDYTGPDSFKGKKIGIVVGYPYLKNTRTPGIRIEQASDDEINVKLLVMGRIDAIVDNILRTGTVITQLGFSDKIIYAKTPFSISKFHIAFNKNVPIDVRTKTDAALREMHQSGAVKKILDKNIYDPIKNNAVRK